MNILVIGGGGREHALVWKLAQSHRVKAIYCAPGNAGIGQVAQCIPLKVDDLSGLRAFAEAHHIDLTVVAPELPLSLGIADEFRRARLRIFGPTRNAARIESSKCFAKDLMRRCKIPTASFQVCANVTQALDALKNFSLPVVIKADGLAQGKGVVVAHTFSEAKAAAVNMLEHNQFGQAGARILLEEYVEGEELTVMAFADGRTVVPMVAAQDHKRVGEQDTGPNTGGMGAYAPASGGMKSLHHRILHNVLYPAVEGLSRVGSPFYGVLYAGLMVRNGEPIVLEFNARFGDPETQVVLPLLQTDLVTALEAVVEHRLDQVVVEWSTQAAVCVVLTSAGYPGSYQTGCPIQNIPGPETVDQVAVFHAGTAWKENEIVTAGGRVLGVTGMGPELKTARERAYKVVHSIQFQGRHFRRDIAQRMTEARA